MTADDKSQLALAEANRAIKSRQTQEPAKGMPKETLEEACERLVKRVGDIPRLPDKAFDERQEQITVEKLRAKWNAPKRHESLSQLDPDAKEWFACYEKLRGRVGSGFTAALIGKRGPGKTQIAMELMRYSTAVLRSAYYCTAMDYFMRIKDAFHPDRCETQAEAQKFFGRFKLLVIDEMNVRSDSTWEDNMLSDLIGKRYNGMLDTILISNESRIEFEQSVGPSIIDRLNETGGIAEATWKSFRQ